MFTFIMDVFILYNVFWNREKKQKFNYGERESVVEMPAMILLTLGENLHRCHFHEIFTIILTNP